MVRPWLRFDVRPRGGAAVAEIEALSITDLASSCVVSLRHPRPPAVMLASNVAPVSAGANLNRVADSST
jgi:hypothetical protein